MTNIDECRIIELPKITDPRGNLTFIEGGRHVPFTIERVFWIYDSPGGERRGGHAHEELQEFFVSLSGSFDVVLDDGRNKRTVTLNRSYYGLYVPHMIWRHLENFSSNSACLVLTSHPYKEEDYLRDYDVFLKMKDGEGHGNSG